MSVSDPVARSGIADYDSNDYDYRSYWAERGYEQRAEAAVLHRLLDGSPPCDWLADLGSGYGRNAQHYRGFARRAVLVDYSVGNLERAAELHGWDVLAGRLHLVRADVNALPFRDGAFDAALVVRLLHHLPDLDVALPEMLRTVAGWAVIDVPIKHHLLAQARALVEHGRPALTDPAPRASGATAYPFHAFRLGAVQTQLADLGWRSDVAASVNNFRRWDQLLPSRGVSALGPAVQALESLAQRVGRGWWGPNQFLHAARTVRSAACSAPPPRWIDPQLGELATRMCCPSCRGDLDWTVQAAGCARCALSFPRRGAFWDFAL